MKKIAIVYMSHDGFTSLYTGVGSVARDFLLSFPKVSSGLQKKYRKYKFDLFATTIKYNEKCFGYSSELKKITENLVLKNKNIHLVELLNGSKGEESYATIDYWKAASISGATFVYTLSQTYDKVVVIAVDTPFAQVANYYFNQYQTDNIYITWLPQSTALIHREDPKKLTKEERERYEWEKKVVDLSKTHKQVYISPVGKFVEKHLIDKYGAKKSKIVMLCNSLYLDSLNSKISTQENIKKLLKSWNVPIDRPLIFSFGRAEYYKGLDLVLKGSLKVIKENNFYVLVLCSPHNDNQNDPVVKSLRKIEKKHKKDMKVITSQNFSQPHLIMQYENLRILAILSRAEPFGLIPIEFRFYKNVNAALLVSNVDGLVEQVKDGADGFVTPLVDENISSNISRIANLSNSEKEKIAYKGHLRVYKEYNQLEINKEFISYFLK